MQIVLIFIISLVAFGVLVYRLVWSARNTPAGWPQRHEPRLIVADAVEGALLVVSLVFFLVTVAVPFTSRFDCSWAAPAGYVWLVFLLLIAAVHLAPGPLRNITHVVMDVINHFRTKGAGFPVRERIDHRFRSVLQHVLDREKPTHLLVIAHSQGTVITLDALQHPDCQAALSRAALRRRTSGWRPLVPPIPISISTISRSSTRR